MEAPTRFLEGLIFMKEPNDNIPYGNAKNARNSAKKVSYYYVSSDVNAELFNVIYVNIASLYY